MQKGAAKSPETQVVKQLCVPGAWDAKIFFQQQWLWKERYCRVMMLHLISLCSLPPKCWTPTCLCPCYWQRANFSPTMSAEWIARKPPTPSIHPLYIWPRGILAAKSTIKPRDVIPISSRGDRILGAGCKKGGGNGGALLLSRRNQCALACKERYNDREKF